jgi:DNA-binding beta-propeller fold protein YncE
VLYVASGTNGVQGILYTVDPATGTVLTTVGPLHDASGNNYGLTGLRYDSSSHILYGATINSSPTNPNYLVIVDPATALVTPKIDPFGAIPTDIAIDPTTGIMYAVSTFNQKFYTINTATGEMVQTGSTGIGFQNGGGMGADITGALFNVDNFSFYSYDKTTGAATLIGPSNLRNLVRAADFSPSNVFYGLEGGGGLDSSHARFLVTCDVTTGTCTRVGTITAQDLDALAFIPQ